MLELTRENAVDAFSMYKASIDENEMLYKPCTLEGFYSIFKNDITNGQTNISIIEDNKRGFASGCYVEGQDKAFITMLVVDKNHRRQGIGRSLLKELEHRILEIGSIKKFEIVFYNPMTLEWNLPQLPHCDHPNAPGIDVGSGAYLFYKNCGYRDFAVQNSYYMDLSQYVMPQSIQDKKSDLSNKNIVFTRYDSSRHQGMNDMIKRFGNPLWERDILGEITRQDGGRPILIAEENGKTCAFTGPLDIQISGRGYFAGIGVDDNYRGNGIANVLFNELCMSLKEMGAEYMTLFTGENNPARNIYEMAGFKIVRTWADMRKEIRSKK